MRHDLAIVVAGALLVVGSQTRVAADSGSLSQGSQDSHNPPRAQSDVGAAPADAPFFAAGMSSDPAVVSKGHEDNRDKDKDKDKNKDGDHHRDGNRENHDKDKDKDKDGDRHHDGNREGDHDKDKDHDKDGGRDHDWGGGGDCGNGDDGGNTPPSPTPEPGTLLLTGLVAASAGLRARRARKSQ